MSNIVDLHGKPISPEGDICPELVSDLARFSEQLLTREDVKRRHRFSNEMWEALGSDERFVAAVREESLRRQRDGSTKREKAQQLVTKAPSILDGIASSDAMPARARIDAIKTLDSFAANGPGAAPTMDRFVITIVLSGDGAEHVERFNKPIAVGINDDDNTPQELITANKIEDGGNGGHL